MRKPQTIWGLIPPLILVCGWAGIVHAQTARAEQVSLGAQWTVDTLSVQNGGLRKGTRVVSDLDLNAAWKARENWSFRGDILVDNGGGFSAKYSGDTQGVSNNDGPSGPRLFQAYAAWTRDDGRLDTYMGLMDFSSHFDVQTPGGDFLNSARHVGTDLAQAGISISPISALGLIADWQPVNNWWLRAGVFDGIPGDPTHPQAFVSVKLAREDGAFLITEAERSIPGGYAKAGAWRRTAASDRLDGNGTSHDSGIYAALSLPLLHGETDPGQGAQLMIRVADASGATLPVSATAAVTLQYTGVFDGRDKDSLGVSLTKAHFSRSLPAGPLADEDNYEVFYRVQVGPNLSIAPDIQYIVNPSGDLTLSHTLVTGIRVILSSGD